MSISPHKNTVFNNSGCTGADKQGVSIFAKRIFFVAGEPGCGKSTFLAALMKKYDLKPSGFITKKEEASSEVAVYMHPVIDGTARYRYTTGSRVGICSPPKPAGFASVFDTYGVMCLQQAEEAALASLSGKCSGAGCPETLSQPSPLSVILMDELGSMETEAERFSRTVCTLFSNPRYYIIGAVKPHGTRFLPVLEHIPEAAIFHLTLQNRAELYAQLEQARNFAAFLDAVSTESQKR